MAELLEVSPDKERAGSMLAMAKVRFEMLSAVDSIKYPSLLVEGYYEVIKELIAAILLLDGYKSRGEGAHKTLIDYLGTAYKDKFSQSDAIFLDELRDKRNRISYDGFFVKEDYFHRKKRIILEIIAKLESILEKRLANQDLKNTIKASEEDIAAGRVQKWNAVKKELC